MYLAALCDDELVVDKRDFWLDVYGFSMRPIFKQLAFEAVVTLVPPSSVCTCVFEDWRE